MPRICEPGGRIVVCDAVAPLDATRAAAFQVMERIRDPSTTRFLTIVELSDRLRDAGVRPHFVRSYPLVVTLGAAAARVVPGPGGANVSARSFTILSMTVGREWRPRSSTATCDCSTRPGCSGRPVQLGFVVKTYSGVRRKADR
jgi:hypothetical protein